MSSEMPSIGAGRVARLAMAAATPLLLLAFAWHLRFVLLLLFAAALIAVVLDGMARFLARHLPIGRGVGLAFAAALLVLAGSGVFWMFGSQLETQITHLISLLPGGWRDLQDWLGEDRVDAVVNRIFPSSGSILAIVQTIGSITASVLSSFFLALIGGIFLATHPATYRRGIMLVVPQAWEERIAEVLDTLARVLRAWLRGQLVSMLFVGTSIYAGLLAIGVSSPLALAVIAALLGFIPVVGPLLAAAPAVLVGLTMETHDLVAIVLLYFVVQNFDGNVLNPLVMSRVVKIPPAVMMFSLFAIGALFGPVGVLLGGPITVFFFTLIRLLWVKGALGNEAG